MLILVLCLILEENKNLFAQSFGHQGKQLRDRWEGIEEII